jgi:hypothetical protein
MVAPGDPTDFPGLGLEAIVGKPNYWASVGQLSDLFQ